MAIKWESVLAHPAPRYLVVNAEEGEPGAFKDRHLMEGDPHLLVEGIAIAAHAIGAERTILYINGQAELAAERMAAAIADAGAAGLLGSDLSIEIYRGAGGYVCGEESVILNSIEGERAVPRPRPPLPTDAGLWGRPTVINNVETLCNLPSIVTDGVAGFREIGTEQYPGTKLVSMSGSISRPGLYEVPIGITARSLIGLAGGLEAGRSLRALVMGGPSGGFLSQDLLDTPLAGGLIHPTGAVLGSGGVVVLDDRMPVSLALRDLTAYNAAESCGKCTPCREGSARALAILDRTGEGGLSDDDRAELLDLCDLLQYASLCGLGQMAPGPIRSAIALFS
jgi:NADH:ubiquinone oxidoreductase subunit F (NADH-binding)